VERKYRIRDLGFSMLAKNDTGKREGKEEERRFARFLNREHLPICPMAWRGVIYRRNDLIVFLEYWLLSRSWINIILWRRGVDSRVLIIFEPVTLLVKIYGHDSFHQGSCEIYG
jgi:hypothetical protein